MIKSPNNPRVFLGKEFRDPRSSSVNLPTTCCWRRSRQINHFLTASLGAANPFKMPFLKLCYFERKNATQNQILSHPILIPRNYRNTFIAVRDWSIWSWLFGHHYFLDYVKKHVCSTFANKPVFMFSMLMGVSFIAWSPTLVLWVRL